MILRQDPCEDLPGIRFQDVMTVIRVQLGKKNKKNGKEKMVSQRIGDEIGGKIDGEMGVGSTWGLMRRSVTMAVRRSMEGRDWKVETLGVYVPGEWRAVIWFAVMSVEGGPTLVVRIGVKAGVSVLEGQDFVCFFCLSTCLLALRKEVGGVKRGAGCDE